MVRVLKGHRGWVNDCSFTPGGRKAITGSGDGTVRLWDVESGRQLVRLVYFGEGEWLAITPEGYYASSAEGDRHINVRVGNDVYGIEQYRERFFRPELIRVVLGGGSLESFATLGDVGKAPRVRILDAPASISTGDLPLTIEIEDAGGGIGDVRVFLDGSAVKTETTRGLDVSARPKEGAMLWTLRLKVHAGDHVVRVIVFNRDNTMHSDDAIAQISCTMKEQRRPSLHALVVGIDAFENPKLALEYSAADANLMSEVLHQVAAGLFEEVTVHVLTDASQTSKSVVLEELKKRQSLSPEDLFVFYVASHGVVDDGEYYLLTSNVGATSTKKLKEDAISQTELKERIANIPTTKKLIILDTCSAGAMGEALQVAMLTRGMSEDTAVKVLSRAVGSTILCAATSAQEALEGYQGHGLFTRVLADGLLGAADSDGDGFVKTLELADYVEDKVAELAEEVYQRKQFPIVSPSGMGFPLGRSVR